MIPILTLLHSELQSFGGSECNRVNGNLPEYFF